MYEKTFYINNKMTPTLEQLIESIDTFEEFETKFSEEFLDEDARVGNYLVQLLDKYEKDAATISVAAGLNRSYVGNIVNRKKNNPGRDVLIAICLSIGTTVEEVQYLLKYAGHAPLYVRRKRDVIIWFAFMKHMSVMDVDQILYARGYKTFFKSE